MLAQVLIAEADAFVAQWKDLKLPDGRDRVVRHGHGPQRAIQTGIGPVEVRRAKVRDRADVETDQKIRFTSAILPKWARRTKGLDALLPILYLRGVSTGDFQEALAALLGKDAPNLSPAVIARLTAEWQVDYDTWQKRDLSARRYVYVWADGVYLQARMEANAECMLVLIGATAEGKKELVGFQTGVRESAQSWRELLIDIKRRGLEIAPDLAVGDGALGFWKAIDEVFPGTRHQRCWVHKTANVLNSVAHSVQVNMKVDLREIYGAPTRAAAEVAIDVFAEIAGRKDYARDKLTNGSKTLPDTDGRLRIARRFRDIAAAILVDQGGAELCSESRRQLIRRFSAACVLAEDLEGRLARGEEIDVERHALLCSTLTRLAQRIGIDRRAKNITPSLSEYLTLQEAAE
jgi:transposase-like protein